MSFFVKTLPCMTVRCGGLAPGLREWVMERAVICWELLAEDVGLSQKEQGSKRLRRNRLDRDGGTRGLPKSDASLYRIWCFLLRHSKVEYMLKFRDLENDPLPAPLC